MDKRFEVYDKPRPDVADSLAGLPLITIAWRAMRTNFSRQRQEDNLLKEALLDIADELQRLRATTAKAAGTAWEEYNGPSVQALLQIADSLQAILGRLGLVIVAPEGEPYTPEYMQVLENIAQIPRFGIDGPQVEEIVQPAMLFRGGLCRMGKAVIALPLEGGDVA